VAPPVLALQDITKTFSGVRALDGVSFDVRAGEVHALVGENGAGKSTLLRIVSGALPRGTFGGAVRIDDRPAAFSSIADAERAAIAIVHQELSLVGPLSVAANIALGHEPNRAGILSRDEASRARSALEPLGVDLDPRQPVERLGIGQQQMVEIAKALSRQARVLVLDEPTAALSDADADRLLARLDRLRARGLAIVYVSHRLGEVFRLADRVTVLRDGRSVATGPISSFDERSLIAAMVGREVDTLFPRTHRTAGAAVLETRRLTVRRAGRRSRPILDDVALHVRAGEVLGIAGLIGAGRSELLLTLFGSAPGTVSGDILVDGATVAMRSPSDAIDRGVALIPEDRKALGLLLAHTVSDNLALPSLRRLARHGWIRFAALGRASADAIARLGIRPPDPHARVGALSGGNQQKVLLGRWLLRKPRVLLLDEPTRGVDIGARHEIYTEIDRLAAGGLAVVVVSSDLPEVLGLSDRVMVMRHGRVAATLAREDATADAVMAAATGAG
jgi:D-xylose transport system ATP-binding protein